MAAEGRTILRMTRCRAVASPAAQTSPTGVPPLELTGERTLPDVPEENYWYRRHLAVYEWIAERVRGLRVADLACGEGYGSDVLAGTRGRGRSASTPTPRRTSTPGCATARPNLRFERGLVEDFDEPRDAIVFLQTIEHIHEPGDAARARSPRSAPVAYVSTPNRLTLAPAGRREVRQPLAPARVHGGRVPRAARAALRRGRDPRPLPRPQAARPRARDPARAGTASTRPCGSPSPSTTASSRRSRPRTSRLRASRATSTGRSTSSPSADALTPASRATSRSSCTRHMPYVEGFGTYPFGEEWLFDAVARSLPAGARGRRAADDDGDPGPRRPARGATGWASGCAAFVREPPPRRRRARRGRAGRRAARPAARPRPSATAARSSASRRSAATPLGAFQRGARREGRVELIGLGRDPRRAAAARDRRRPARCRSTPACARTAAASATPPGFWLPECAYEPGLERLLAERGIGYFCTRPERARASRGARSRPIATAGGAGRVHDRLAGGRPGSGRWTAIPRTPRYAEFHRESLQRHPALVDRRRARTTRRRPRRARASRRASSSPPSPSGSRATASATGSAGLLVFAIDTELLGHWWCGGPAWLAEVVAARAGRTGSASDPRRGARASTRPRSARCARSSWGEGKDLSTWDSPAVADLAWGARRLELRLLRALGERGSPRRAAERAARELLAVQASDWAFLDQRGQAGDYPFQRVDRPRGGHARGHRLRRGRRSPRMRNLAPDLSLAPLLEP